MNRLYSIIAFLLAAGFLTPYAQAQSAARPNIEGPGGINVNTYSGNVFYERVDLEIPGRGPTLDLDLAFSYNSHRTALNFGYGNGWTFSYNLLYELQGPDVLIRRSDGASDLYSWNGSSYTPPAGVYDKLEEYQPGKFRLVTPGGTTYFFDDAGHKRLTSQVDRNSNTISLAYNGGLPQSISDACGRMLNFVFTGGQLTQITDNNTNPARTIAYQYDASGNKTLVTDPLGNQTSYTYDASRNLTQIQDPRASLFTVTYDAAGRALSVASSITQTTLAYGASSTSVTEVGTTTNRSHSYHFDGQGRVIQKTGSCCGFNQSYVYDAQNNITQITDANSNVTSYTYDGLGNVLTETDALSQTASYTYVANTDRLASETDKNGQTTSYTYDARGNLSTISRPLGVTESFSYDAHGNTLSHTDGSGFTTNNSYDACGNLTNVSYPIGGESMTYDNVGNMLTHSDALNNTTSYTYDLLNRELSSTDAVSCTESQSYDGNGNIVSETDGNGNTTMYTYDVLDREITITRPNEIIVYHVYNEFGELQSETDPMGNTTQFSYDSNGLLILETNALNDTRSFTYDANGNVLSETDFNGAMTTYVYDALDRVISATDALNNTSTYTYDGNSNRTSETDARGHTTTNTYDALNRLIRVTRASQIMAEYSYNGAGLMTQQKDAINRSFSFTYDAGRRMTQIQGPLGYTVSYSYDAAGRILSMTDANNLTISFSYDAADQVVSETNGAGVVTSYVYDCNGNVTARHLPNGNIETQSYDPQGNLLSVTDNLAAVVNFLYDKNSRMTSASDANNNTDSFSYDAYNRLISVTDAMGRSTLYTYNALSQIENIQDRNAKNKAFTYDVLGRRLTMVDNAGNTSSFTYDEVGNVISRTDPDGNATTYTYDAHNRMIQETFADLSSQSFTYNGIGQKLTRSDAAGNVTSYVYDALGRIILRDFPGSNDDSYSYDLGGRLLTAVNNAATVTYTYDNADRVISESINGLTTSYSLNAAGAAKTITYPSGRTIEMLGDARMRLQRIREGGLDLVTFTYDGADNMIGRSFPQNGSSLTMAYDPVNRLIGMEHGPGAFVNIQYTLDNEGNTSVAVQGHRPTHSEAFSYDNACRLAGRQVGTWTGMAISPVLSTSSYFYDPAGSRTTRNLNGVVTNYTDNNVNAYVSIVKGGTPSTPLYDAIGNLTNDGSNSYSYDYENHLSSINGGLSATYRYDALGRRVEKQTPAGTERYYYSLDNIIEERDGNGSVLATYVYGNATDEILSMRRNGQDYYYHQDGQGSVVALTDGGGSVVERYSYEAYGAPTIYDPAWNTRTATAVGNHYLYTGRFWDSESGLYYNRARYYDPENGRFINRDPIGTWGDLHNQGNAYAYVGNDPLNYTDPTGLKCRYRRCKTSVHCKAPWPGPRKIRIKFRRCASSKRAKAKQDICKAFRAAGNGYIAVRDYVNGKGTQANLDKTENNIRLWFGMHEREGPRKRHLRKICRKLKKTYKAFNKKLKIKCKGRCKGYVAKTQWFVGKIKLCRKYFAKDPADRAAILLHEITHRYARTYDNGYAHDSGNSSKGYYTRGLFGWGKKRDVTLSRRKKSKNADSYENFLRLYF